MSTGEEFNQQGLEVGDIVSFRFRWFHGVVTKISRNQRRVWIRWFNGGDPFYENLPSDAVRLVST